MVDMRNISGNAVPLPAQTGNKPISAPPKKQQSSADRRSPRARLNFMPDDDLLSKLITRARSALSSGIYWDRGAIVNLLL